MADARVKANPLIQWREVADAGHYIHDDQPERVAQLVREFLLDPASQKPRGSARGSAA